MKKLLFCIFVACSFSVNASGIYHDDYCQDDLDHKDMIYRSMESDVENFLNALCQIKLGIYQCRIAEVRWPYGYYSTCTQVEEIAKSFSADLILCCQPRKGSIPSDSYERFWKTVEAGVKNKIREFCNSNSIEFSGDVENHISRVILIKVHDQD